MRSLWTFLCVVLLFAPGVNAQGTITTVAGTGLGGFNGDGIPATSARLANPVGVAVDSAGNLIIADTLNHRIRRVDATTGVITTVAGNGIQGFSGDGGPATSARLNVPIAVGVDSAGNLFIADVFNLRIRRVDAATGIITTVAGNGLSGFNGDGIPATSARLDTPQGVALDGAGNLFIADTLVHRIRRVDAVTGIITTVAGTGLSGSSGDGGPATSARLGNPIGVAMDNTGNLFIGDVGAHRIRKVVPGADGQITGANDEIITTVAGTSNGFSGDGGPATSARLLGPHGVAVDSAGNLFIADRGNHRIRKVVPGADGQITGATDEIITTVAGTGVAGFSGDGGPATSARLNGAFGVAVDGTGNLFIADLFNRRIRGVVFVLTVDIDIKPGSDPNAINPVGKGLTPVAILTTDTFDATTVSPITVRFGPAGASMVHRSGHLEDVDGDGDLDLVLHFRTQEIGIQCGDTEASLSGETFGGQAIQGSDSVLTVGCS
jgi:sugar lactone lactonase YvrE